MNNDYLVRAIGASGRIKIAIANTTNTVETARASHNTFPVATAALGRSLTAGLLLGTNLKEEDLLTLRFLGDGPIGGIIVTVEPDYKVRGYVVNPQIDLPLNDHGKLDVAKAVGQGIVSVTKDYGLKEPYSGTAEIISGEIAVDIANYLQISEQINSAVSLGVLVNNDCTVKAAGGFMIQLLPDAKEAELEILEENIGKLEPISTLINWGLSPEDILARLMKGIDYEILETHPVQFCCNCSKERFERVLINLGELELGELADRQEDIELQCHFCSRKYYFSPEDIRNILKEIEQGR